MEPSKEHIFSAPNTLLFIFLITATVLPFIEPTHNVIFDFSSLTLRNLTLLGDSYLRRGTVGLTRDVTVPSSSSGTVIYNNPIHFFDSSSNRTAGFSTKFTFSISNVNPNSFGDGLTFFLSRDDRTLGSPGGFLGLVNSSLLTKNRFVAIEFDTRLDDHFDDPNGNHIGLDIDSPISTKTADSSIQGIDLKSGNLITSWIDYQNDVKILQVFLSYTNEKPQNPLLDVGIDLSGYLRDAMYVGFSGSTEGSTELHLIENWSFKTTGFDSELHNLSDTSVIVPKPDIPIPNSAKNHRNRLGFVLGIAFPAFFCAFSVGFGYFIVRKWKKMKRIKSLRAELVAGPREFSYKELRTATKGFDSSRLIGRGSFGNVYKAYFKSSDCFAAVKRSKHFHEGKTEFLAELSIIACLRHKNLVQIQGWCIEKDELLLVYEFMPYGSLDKLLYPETEKCTFLTWSYRLNIAIGLASVLAYLHQECEQQVIHRDIKTSNVMLDANFNLRLGDFGLARLMDHGKSPVSTLTAGTMGYLAPEYLHYGKANEMSDVFSYGVVILEVACGKRPIERVPSSEKMKNLVDWVWELHGEGRIIEAADQRLNFEFSEDEMERLLMVGLSCANPDSSERPKMRRVLQILKGEAEGVAVPKMKPSLSFSSGLCLTLDDIVSDSE